MEKRIKRLALRNAKKISVRDMRQVGVIKIKQATMLPEQVDEFRKRWHELCAGIDSTRRLVISDPNETIEFLKVRKTSRIVRLNKAARQQMRSKIDAAYTDGYADGYSEGKFDSHIAHQSKS